MSTILNSPQILTRSPEKLVLSLSNSVEVFTIFIHLVVMLGITVSIVLSYGLMFAIFPGLMVIVSLIGLFSAYTVGETTYIFDKVEQQLVVKQARSTTIYTLEGCQVSVQHRMTGPVMGSSYYQVELSIPQQGQGNFQIALSYNSSSKAEQMAALIRDYLLR